MSKNTGKQHGERFETAVMAGTEQEAESLVERLGDGDLPLLHRLAQSADADHCWWGVRGLASAGDATSVPLLVAHLDHADALVRAAAVMALGELHRRAPQPVNAHLGQMAALLADDDGLVRQAAVDGLAACGDDAVDMLAEMLESKHDGVRVRAAAALHRIGTRKTALPLYHHLEDPNPLVRHHAYEALSELGLLTNILLAR